MNLLTEGYRSFVKKLRAVYPHAKLVLLTGYDEWKTIG